jgi:hypothetical protein
VRYRLTGMCVQIDNKINISTTFVTTALTEQDRQRTYNVTLRRVPAASAARLSKSIIEYKLCILMFSINLA